MAAKSRKRAPKPKPIPQPPTTVLMHVPHNSFVACPGLTAVQVKSTP